MRDDVHSLMLSRRWKIADFHGISSMLSKVIRPHEPLINHQLSCLHSGRWRRAWIIVDSLDPFSEGILFSVRPPQHPNISWKNILNLSGGENTLSSLALVFALHHNKPTPLYVMDEIDAALDFRNVSIVGNYIKERTKNAQFIIISLRNNVFELADRLVGIYKTNDCTKSITIDPKAFSNQGQASKSSGPLNERANAADHKMSQREMTSRMEDTSQSTSISGL